MDPLQWMGASRMRAFLQIGSHEDKLIWEDLKVVTFSANFFVLVNHSFKMNTSFQIIQFFMHVSVLQDDDDFVIYCACFLIDLLWVSFLSVTEDTMFSSAY